MRRPGGVIALLWLGAVGVLGLASCGPHMERQSGLRPYKTELPEMPAGTVPQGGIAELPAADATNPVAATAENLALGKRYYGYYCAHCHGADGKGQVPVGQSYDVSPRDLTAAQVQGMKDGELYRRMLTGVGHEPVMAATVAEGRRWYVVLWVRAMGGGDKAGR